MARRFPPMPRSLTLQGCFARVPSAKPNIQTTTKSAGLAFKGDTLASCPARGARACSGKTAVSFNDDPKVALGGFGSSRCALGRLQLVHCRGLCARRWGRWCWECRVWTPGGPAKNLKMKMEEKEDLYSILQFLESIQRKVCTEHEKNYHKCNIKAL